MNVLNIEHVSKLYGDKMVLGDVSYGIQEGEKIGIIGINGTGKTTLLRILAGEEEPDSGQVIRQNGLKIAFLKQNQEFPENASVLSCVMDGRKEDWSLESEAKSMLNTLGIPEHEAQISHLSGGQKKRVALAHVLLEPSDVLILDEPTNHLDQEMVSWLEDYLRRYKGIVVMVTHDRYFLDQVTNHILEISQGNLYAYQANYSKFLEMKAQREDMELASERKRQSILRMELEWAKRGCRARTTKQRARLERLEALKNGKTPVSEQTVEMDSVETRMGKKTVELHQISKSFGDKIIVKDFEYIFLKNQKIGIVGSNGCGKSTLLKIIAGVLKPDEGFVEMGETIKMSYFAQDVPDMDTNQRVIDYVKDIAEYIPTREGRITASQMLERFLFTPDMQYAPISKLSGGEKRRLYLLGILQSSPNFLVMDEVSNELDIPTLTILEDYLNSFSGIVVLVSHDRYFLDNVVDRIFEFDGEGHLQQYEGGYTDYLEAKQKRNGSASIAEGSSYAKTSGRKEEVSWDKGERKLKFSYKEAKEFETIEDDIAALEEKLEELDTEMTACASQYSRLTELTEEKEAVQQALDEKMERWMYLTELNEKIQAQK